MVLQMVRRLTFRNPTRTRLKSPAPRETEAIAARPYHFSVDGFALREAFLATSLTSAGDQLRVRIFNDHLTLVSHNNGIHCEADVENSANFWGSAGPSSGGRDAV